MLIQMQEHTSYFKIITYMLISISLYFQLFSIKFLINKKKRKFTHEFFIFYILSFLCLLMYNIQGMINIERVYDQISIEDMIFSIHSLILLYIIYTFYKRLSLSKLDVIPEDEDKINSSIFSSFTYKIIYIIFIYSFLLGFVEFSIKSYNQFSMGSNFKYNSTTNLLFISIFFLFCRSFFQILYSILQKTIQYNPFTLFFYIIELLGGISYLYNYLLMKNNNSYVLSLLILFTSTIYISSSMIYIILVIVLYIRKVIRERKIENNEYVDTYASNEFTTSQENKKIEYDIDNIDLSFDPEYHLAKKIDWDMNMYNDFHIEKLIKEEKKSYFSDEENNLDKIKVKFVRSIRK